MSKKKIAALCYIVLLGVVAYRLVAGGVLQDLGGWMRGLRYRHTGIVKAQGVEFCLPPGDWFTNHLIEFGSWEPFETELLRSQLREGDVFVDVGAHYGYYTLIAARIVGDKGRVIAFEPDPKSFAILKRNVEHNGFRNVILENVAASNASGTVRLYLASSAMEDSMINAHQSKEAIDVKAVRLDDYFADSTAGVDVIKIDTEGAEAMILQGMENILRKNKSVRLVLEYSPRLLEKSGHDPDGVLTKLMGLGFRIQFLDEAGGALVDLPPNSTSRFTEHLRAESSFVNLFLRRPETNQ